MAGSRLIYLNDETMKLLKEMQEADRYFNFSKFVREAIYKANEVKDGN